MEWFRQYFDSILTNKIRNTKEKEKRTLYNFVYLDNSLARNEIGFTI